MPIAPLDDQPTIVAAAREIQNWMESRGLSPDQQVQALMAITSSVLQVVSTNKDLLEQNLAMFCHLLRHYSRGGEAGKFQAAQDRYEDLSTSKRLWMLVPGRRDVFVPGLDGTFLEALEGAAKRAAFNKTVYQIYEADPEKYRREGGLKQVWATVSTPKQSPLRVVQ